MDMQPSSSSALARHASPVEGGQVIDVAAASLATAVAPTPLETFIVEAKRLRRERSKSELQFLMHLLRGEQNEELWRGTGHQTFAALLSSYNLCDPRVFESFKSCFERFGIATLEELGFDALRTALPMPNEIASLSPGIKEPAVRAAIGEMREVRAREGVAPSGRHAAAIVSRHWQPERRPSKPVGTTEEQLRVLEHKYGKCEVERARLAKENADLRPKLAETRAQLERVSKALRASEAALAKATAASGGVTSKRR